MNAKRFSRRFTEDGEKGSKCKNVAAANTLAISRHCSANIAIKELLCNKEQQWCGR